MLRRRTTPWAGPTTRQLVTLAHVLVVAACCAFVWLQLQPNLILSNTTPSGGDMGAHVWGPAFLRDHLLPQGRITGWSMDWYSGFPFLVFYFPLPSLVIALLSYVLPYGIAFKLVAVAGLVTMPVAAAAMAALNGMRRPYAACVAIATVPYVFDRGWTIYGGNAASTLAGEFSFSISLSLALVFLGVLGRSLDTGRHRGLAAALFAATVLCHILPALFAIAGAVALTAVRGRLRGFLLSATVGVVALAIAGFWLFPFQQRLAYSNDMGWDKITQYRVPLLGELPFGSAVTADQLAAVGQQGLDARALGWLVVLAAGGAVASIALRRRLGLVLVATAAASALAFRFMPGHDSTLPLAGKLWNARMLPFWYLSLYLLAACLLAEVALAAIHLYRRLDPSTSPGSVDAATEAARGAERLAALDAILGGGLAGVDARAVSLRVRDRAERIRERARIARAVPQAAVPILAAFVVLNLVAGPFGHSLIPAFNERGSSYIDDWARWNFAGYEAEGEGPQRLGRKERRDEYFALVRLMRDIGDQRGCGRAFWEYEPELDAMGTPMALMLLPYWTDGCIASSEGLYFESSATTPYHFLTAGSVSLNPSNPQRSLPYTPLDLSGTGIARMEMLGMRYYMAISEEAKAQADADPRLERIAETGVHQVRYSTGFRERSWAIYELRGGAVVEPLATLPVVAEGLPEGELAWKAMSAQGWFADPGRMDVLIASSGPRSWPRVRVPEPTATSAPSVEGTGRHERWRLLGAEADLPRREVAEPAEVSDIRMGNRTVRFRVDRPGTPVLVKVSYFPNWRASGADGPYRVTPNLMVVVPTGTEVTLRYGWTPVDAVGWLLTLLGIAAAVVLSRRRARLEPVLGRGGVPLRWLPRGGDPAAAHDEPAPADAATDPGSGAPAADDPGGGGADGAGGPDGGPPGGSAPAADPAPALVGSRRPALSEERQAQPDQPGEGAGDPPDDRAP